MPSYEQKPIEERCDLCERELTVMRLLGQTRYGDHRPAYRRNGKLTFPVLSPLEIKARREL